MCETSADDVTVTPSGLYDILANPPLDAISGNPFTECAENPVGPGTYWKFETPTSYTLYKDAACRGPRGRRRPSVARVT